MDKVIHIISFSIPYPANYGGVIDVYYKLKALNKVGVKVILHCFKYDREEAKELEDLCEDVFYYDRKMKGAHLLSFLPFIVSSRTSKTLLNNLLKDDYPILYEGLHTCATITDRKLKNRVRIVRSHNIEHDYYNQLASVEKKLVKRLYFKSEAKKLKRFEGVAMRAASHILGISNKDSSYLNNQYGKSVNMSAFHAFEDINVGENFDHYALYHGNLEVGENNEAALYLVNQVFKEIDYPLIIAGNNPSHELINACSGLKNVTLEANLKSEDIITRVNRAHINILPTFQSTGIKLKLLAALFNGNHVLVNKEMVQGTGLESCVVQANTASEFKKAVSDLKEIKSTTMLDQRRKILAKYSNESSIQVLLNLL